VSPVPGCGMRAVRSTEGILTTDREYYIPTEPPLDLTEPTELSHSQPDLSCDSNVEVSDQYAKHHRYFRTSSSTK